MNEIRNLLKEYSIKNNKFTIKNKAIILDDKYVIKKKNHDKRELYDYLSSRNFDYYPKVFNSNNRDNYDIYEYINDIKTPDEQKALDIISLITLLHKKTTFYRSVTSDVFKEKYEELKNQVNDVKNYYQLLFEKINNSIYMSPSEYLIIRNISKIFASLEYCDIQLEKFLELTKNIKRQRLVTIHNNLELNHIIKNDRSYLISWDKSKIDIPIYDLFVFYKNNYLDLDFFVLIKEYNDKYPLFEDEKTLFLILISIPKKIKVYDNEFDTVTYLNRIIEYIYSGDKLIKALKTKEND